MYEKILWRAAIRNIVFTAAVSATLAAIVVGIVFAAGCTKQERASIAAAGARAVVDETCQELEGDAGIPAGFVSLSCPSLADAAAGVVSVIMPETEWKHMKARRVDAGAGK